MLIPWKVVLGLILLWGAGDDIIKGGKAGFDEMGVPGQDIAIYSKAESSYLMILQSKT